MYSRLAGEFVGWYYAHGFEIVQTNYTCTIEDQQTVHSLTATKITGDANIPATKETFSLKQSVNNGEIIESGRGQIAEHGYINPQFINGRLIYHAGDYSSFAFLFDGLGPLLYFRRDENVRGTETISEQESADMRERMQVEIQTLHSTLGTSRYESQNYNIGNVRSASNEKIASNLIPAEPREENCSICLTELENNVVELKNCNHTFHDTCIRGWLSRVSSCPYCRRDLI